MTDNTETATIEQETKTYSKPLSAKSRELIYILSVANILIGYLSEYENQSDNPEIQAVIDKIKTFNTEFAEVSRDLADAYVKSFDVQKYSEIIRMALMNCQIMTKYSVPDIATIFRNGVNGVDVLKEPMVEVEAGKEEENVEG